MALSNTTPSPVIQLHARRELRASSETARLIASELERVRERLLVLTTAGNLFQASGSREGRKLLSAQELLFEAQAHLVERSGQGALPAPRLEATREKLLAQAKEKLERARHRLGRDDAGKLTAR